MSRSPVSLLSDLNTDSFKAQIREYNLSNGTPAKIVDFWQDDTKHFTVHATIQMSKNNEFLLIIPRDSELKQQLLKVDLLLSSACKETTYKSFIYGGDLDLDYLATLRNTKYSRYPTQLPGKRFTADITFSISMYKSSASPNAYGQLILVNLEDPQPVSIDPPKIERPAKEEPYPLFDLDDFVM